MTQKKLSDYLGLTPKMISFYELGQRVPPSDIMLKLAERFQVLTDYLLGNDTPVPHEAHFNEGNASAPHHMDARSRRQLEKVLDEDQLTYNGVILNGEDKEKVKRALELVFWDIKEKNKEKYTRRKKK